MEQAIERVGRGTVAGIGATTAMSAVMLAAQRAGLVGKLPPEHITERFLDALHISRTRPEQKAVTVLSHYGYGAATGALFGMVQGRVAPRHPILEGIAFGGLVWLLSYAGWVPAAGILPAPSRDRRPGRQLTLVLVHVVFGGVLGWLARRRR